ncbi:hypothetical protein ACHAWF_017354 [Thalassiosira exigua]
MMKALFVLLLFRASAAAFQVGRLERRGAAAPPLAASASIARRRSRGAGATTATSPSASVGASEHATTPSDVRSERRSFLRDAARSVALSSVVLSSGGAAVASAADAGDDDLGRRPKVTQKVFLDVRVSRADGTFYVRDADPAKPADEPLYGRLVLGLFGDAAPNHVRRFLGYVDAPYDVDNPLPSYSRSKFQTLDTATGLLIGGTIPGLEVTTLAGGNVLEYSGRVIPAKLWLEDRNAPNGGAMPALSHDAKGLLTHRNLDLTPSFGITTRKSSTSLDSTHTVFGCILEDEGGFLENVVDLPVLTDEGRVSRTASDPNAGGDVGGSLASSVFAAQRAVFRDAAKTFGDSRLGKVYDGKLLRRIEVTKVGVL